MNALQWWFIGYAVAALAAFTLIVVILWSARREERREDMPEDELEPRERRGAWSRIMCRNRRTNRLGRWIRNNKVLR